MKRFLFLLCALLIFVLPASAEDLPGPASSLLSAAHPDHTLSCVVSAAEPVIAVMSMGDEHVLCIAEKQNDIWVLTVDNPTALRRGELPAFLWEGGMSLFYRYGAMDAGDYATICDYHAQRTSDGWSDVDLTIYAAGSFMETGISYHSGAVCFLWQNYDAQGNPQGEAVDYPPFPQPHLQDKVNLTSFDISAFPTSLRDLSLQEIGDVLSPGCTVISGAAGEAVSLIADLPDGTRRFLGGVWNTADWAWRVTVSTPLPQDTACDDYHSDGDHMYLHLLRDGEGYITVSLQADSTWRVNYIGRRDWFSLGPNWVTDEDGKYYFGDFRLPLDVTEVDWEKLPYTMLEAFDLLDCTAWTTVNNPDPEDRLHLRAKPSRSAASLGKYYNGTPVKVLQRSGDWAQVDIFGVQGWMMCKYLSLGESMGLVESAMPVLFVRDDLSNAAPLYRDTKGHCLTTLTEGTLSVMGVIGDDYYHVLGTYDPSVHGYMRQIHLFPGNG